MKQALNPMVPGVNLVQLLNQIPPGKEGGTTKRLLPPGPKCTS